MYDFINKTMYRVNVFKKIDSVWTNSIELTVNKLYNFIIMYVDASFITLMWWVKYFTLSIWLACKQNCTKQKYALITFLIKRVEF